MTSTTVPAEPAAPAACVLSSGALLTAAQTGTAATRSGLLILALMAEKAFVYLTGEALRHLPDRFPFAAGGEISRHIEAGHVTILENGWVSLEAVPHDGSVDDQDSWVTVTLPPTSVAAIVRP